jgi:hypothetical protein
MFESFQSLGYVDRLLTYGALLLLLITGLISWVQIVRKGRSASVPTWMAALFGGFGLLVGMQPLVLRIADLTKNVVWPANTDPRAVAYGILYYVLLPIIPAFVGVLPIILIRAAMARWRTRKIDMRDRETSESESPSE